MRSDVLDGARLHLVSGHPPSGPASRTPLQWWAHLDSNQDLTGYEPAALPLSYGPAGSSYAVRTPRSSGASSSATVSELAQGLGLDLADALARDGEVLPDLFQRVLAAVG